MESNNEYDFSEFNDLIEYLKELDSTPSVRIVCPDAVKSVLSAYETVKASVSHGQGKCEVSYAIHEPFDCTGSVRIIGRNIVIKDPEKFISAVLTASNFEVYAKTDGTVQANLTFHGLTM